LILLDLVNKIARSKCMLKIHNNKSGKVIYKHYK